MEVARFIREQAARIDELEAQIALQVDYGEQVAKLERRNAELRKDNDALKQREAEDAVGGICPHAWHTNPALITACPECGAGES